MTVKEVFVADIKSDGSLGEMRTIINDLPDAGQHPNRTLAVKNNQLYITGWKHLQCLRRHKS
ncbi:MAG: hypothetical protein WKF90_09880 [Pyrinomonadaceae bacterium]